MKPTLTFYHFFFALLLISSIGVMILYVPPDNVAIISLLITLISFTSFYVTALVTNNRHTRILVAGFVGMQLFMNAAIGFNLLNTALLLSFIIGLKLVLR